MLKDSEEIIRRHKLSLAHTTDTTAASTPPITPPTPPPLNMMMAAAAAVAAAANAPPPNSHAARNTPPTLTPNSMAASLLASKSGATLPSTAAAAAAAAAATSAVQDHYSLRWNNHQAHILRAFDALLQNKALVDVTLVCAETSIHAHKIVLSACSPFFARVFAETPCKHPVIVLKDFRGWVVQAIVDFMYRGEISVPQERLQTLIQAGESLQVRGLVESSVPEHTPTPAASPDDFGMIDTSLMSSELERCSSFDEESPSMVTAGSKIILPSRLFGSTVRREQRERERERKRERQRGGERDRERERDREPDLERVDTESDQELQHESGTHSDLCTSPLPRRKQARPRRRSGDLPLELTSKPASPLPMEMDERHEQEAQEEQPLDLNKERKGTPEPENIEALKTVIKTEMLEQMHEHEVDSGNGNDSGENTDSPVKSIYPNEQKRPHSSLTHVSNDDGVGAKLRCTHEMAVEEDEDDNVERSLRVVDDTNGDSVAGDTLDHHDDMDDDVDPEQEPEDIEELIQTSNELRRKSQSHFSDGDLPEDLCTTKKDNDTSGHHSASDNECSPINNNNNNNNNNKLSNNNNRIVLSLKDIRHLNKPSSSSTPNSANNMNIFANASLRDLRLDRAVNAAAAVERENQCKIDALEAQMHAAAAAAAAAAASGENPFQHMEHQMDLSLAAAAAAAAVSHRERDQVMQREQREFQQQHNAYANSILGQMGMPNIPGHFGPPGPGNGPGGGGPAPHERLEESMNRLSKEFASSSPMDLPAHFNPPDGSGHPHSPLSFPGMPSALGLTPPPHMFGLDSPLGLFPPGLDPKLYNPLMEMADPRALGPEPQPYLKKKMPRPKGQHSAPRGGPPRSWTNAELTEALQHVWNKKMTTSQASRIFGIPYNSLLMYVRGKYGKSLKLEELRKDCISGPPLELLQMGINNSTSTKSSKKTHESHDKEARNSKSGELRLGIPPPPPPGGGPVPLPDGSIPCGSASEADLLGGPNSIFNPFQPGFYPDFGGGFPGLSLGMLNLLPPPDRHAPGHGGIHQLSMDEDCKSDRSKQSSMDEEFAALASIGAGAAGLQPLALNRNDEQRRNSNGLLTTVGSSRGSTETPTTAANSNSGSGPTGAVARPQSNGGIAQD